MKKCTNDVRGVRRKGEQRNNESEGWSEEICVVVAEKIRAFEE